jgi:hypothetical protein
MIRFVLAFTLAASYATQSARAESPLEVCTFEMKDRSMFLIFESTTETSKDFTIGQYAGDASSKVLVKVVEREESGNFDLNLERVLDCTVESRQLNCTGDDQIERVSIDYSNEVVDDLLFGFYKSRYFRGMIELSYPTFIKRSGRGGGTVRCGNGSGFTWST